MYICVVTGLALENDAFTSVYCAATCKITHTHLFLAFDPLAVPLTDEHVPRQRVIIQDRSSYLVQLRLAVVIGVERVCSFTSDGIKSLGTLVAIQTSKYIVGSSSRAACTAYTCEQQS